MFIRLLPSQVPRLWNQIKYAASNADRVNERDLPKYLTRLLHALMSEKAQCFIRLNEDRTLMAVVITRILIDDMTGDKSLLIQCLYSFQGVPDQEWKEDMDIVELFAQKTKCKKILSYSNNPRVYELTGQLNFEERYRCFVKNLEA